MEHKKQMSRYGDDENGFQISYEPHKSGTYHIYLFGCIESPTQFIGAVEVMRMASENDTIIIHLQSGGGSIDATDTLIQAMRECEAPVVVRASGGCHSAASIILLEADHFTLSESFSSLIHNGSTGSIAKFSDYKSETQFTVKWMERTFRDAYEGFLTEAEIEDVLKGVDLWLDGDEWMRRANNRNEYAKAKIELIKNPPKARKPRAKKPVEQPTEMMPG